MPATSPGQLDSTQARRALRDLKKYIKDGARVRLLETAALIVRRMEIYPPPLPKSRYVRTYRFKKDWRIAEGPNSVMVANMVRNRRNKPYAGWVVGNSEGEMQAKVHQGRWPVFRTVADAAIQRLPVAVIKDLQLIVKQPGQK